MSHRKPVWPTVFLGGCFFVGYNYGVERQNSLNFKARDQVQAEKDLIEHYNTIRWSRELKEAAIAHGDDPSLYEIPDGMRTLARSFKETSL